MSNLRQPVLSIGMIVKNESRCLERCLRSFQPLREAIPCELVIADTGSDDGSWEIAERYADILFHFDWVDDFAAARNAVLDRCTGRWHLAVDADEWLDGEFQQLVEFLSGANARHYEGAAVYIRNYASREDFSAFSDFFGARMVRMDCGIRYEGSIHEAYGAADGHEIQAFVLDRVILHHDGYAAVDPEYAKQKSARNMKLLRAELEKFPNDLRRILQCIESAGDLNERLDYVQRGVALLKTQEFQGSPLGPVIFRHAVNVGQQLRKWGFFEESLSEARRLYPRSIFVQVDCEGFGLLGYYAMEEYEQAAKCGEAWKAGLTRYHNAASNRLELLYGTIDTASNYSGATMESMLFDCYCKLKRWEKASRALERVELDLLSQANWAVLVGALINQGGELDNTAAQLQRLWDTVAEQMQAHSEQWKARRDFLMNVLNGQFSLAAEGTVLGIHRVIAQLKNCEPGRSARILLSTNPVEVAEELQAIRCWNDVLYGVYPHAIRVGCPLPDSFYEQDPIRLAEVAGVLHKYDMDFSEVVLVLQPWGDEPAPLAKLSWMLLLLANALRVESWGNVERGGCLCERFEALEREYLSRMYSEEALNTRNIVLLPALHRFGWCYLQAVNSLRQGDVAEYVRKLKRGLESMPAMKDMVFFLTEQLKHREAEKRKSEIAQASPELVTLAEQVRGILAAHPVDDPAVQVLKQSPAYQKVAFLIEEPASQFTM